MEENNRKELCDKIYHMAKKKMLFNEICKKLELNDIYINFEFNNKLIS